MAVNTNSNTVKWWQSLRFSLIVVLIAVSIIPIVAITLVLSNGFREQMIEQVTAQLQSVSTLKTSEINTWLNTAHSEIDLLTENPLTRTPILAVLDGTDADMEQVLYISNSLTIAVKESGVLESLFVYDLDGNILLGSNPADVGKIVTRQPYFSPSLTDDEFYLQPPFYDIAGAELTIIGTEPIMNDAGETVGIVAARLTTDTLSNIMIERSGLGESGETYLVSLENNYLLTPSLFEGYPQNRAYTSFGIEQALNQVEGAGIYGDYRNPPVPVIGVYSWIPRLQSAMLVEIDESEALTAFNQALLSGTQAIIAVAIIVVIIGIWVSNRIARPIIWLSQTAQAIAAGDLTRRTTAQGNSELALLGKSFNQMTKKLARNINELDANVQKVEKANRELAKQTALAREATRLKSEFLATMSHELRTPLNAIKGFTGILLFDAEEMDEDNVHMLNRIESNSDRLLTLIDDVLDLSKIEAGRVEIVREPIHVPTIVDQWIAETSVLAENKNLPLLVEVSSHFPDKIYGDSARLAQIAKNLLSNAIKFTDNGSVQLRVTTDEDHWQIEVQDSGIGIAPHAQNYIFDEFRQVDGSSKRVYGGTGLGLAITRNLVLMMNGTIDVTSQLGEGSTFTVRLPLYVVERAESIVAN